MATGRLGPVYVFGVNAAREVVQSPRVKAIEVLIEEGSSSKRMQEVVRFAEKLHLPVRLIPQSELERLAGGAMHQGIAVKLREWPYRGERELFDTLSRKVSEEKPSPFYIMLDHLQDVGNFGAVIRTSYLCGASGIIVPRTRSAPVTSAVVRTSEGAAVHVDIFQVANLNMVIRKLKTAGLWIFGLETGSKKNILEMDLAVPLVLVMGGEHQGISRLVKENCDEVISLPMTKTGGSYNVSVAAGMAMFEVMRQRSQVG